MTPTLKDKQKKEKLMREVLAKEQTSLLDCNQKEDESNSTGTPSGGTNWVRSV